jgi:hypothetical protein
MLATVLAVVAAGSLLAGHAGAASSSSAGTTVSVDGTTVNLTVHVDLFVGTAEDTSVSAEHQQIAQGIARDIEAYWNAGLARYVYRGCATLHLTIDMHVLPPSATKLRRLSGLDYAIDGEPGFHAIEWANVDGVRPVVYDATATATATGDYVSPYQHELFGYWSDALETPRDFAHETGHLLGLGDDYVRQPDGGIEPLPGREGTLMGGGDMIDQELVNRLGDIAAKSGQKLPACYTGTLTFSVLQPVPSGRQLLDYTADVVVAPAARGKLEGSVRGTYTQTLHIAHCPSHTTTPGRADGTLAGTLDTTAMHLEVSALPSKPPAVTPCESGGQPGLMGSPLQYPEIARMLANLASQGGDVYAGSVTATEYSGPYPFTVKTSVRLARSGPP